MTRKKSNKFLSIFAIFFRSIKVYFMYLDKTAKYMLIPVFGQLIGLSFIFLITYYFNINIKSLMKIQFFAQSTEHLLFALFIVLLPFLALFLYSLYKYIIAFCSLNVIFYTLTPKKKVKEIDFDSGDKFIERRLFQYIILMLMVSVLCVFPPLWIVLCLSFQVFALEPDTNCFKALGRSIRFTLENIIFVILMLILVFGFSYWFLPSLFIWALEKVSVVDFLVTRLEVYLNILPYNDWNRILSVFGQHIDSVTIAKASVETALMSIIVGFTLPFRCACFTELYRMFDNEQIKEYSKTDEEIIKRASSKKSKNRQT